MCPPPWETLRAQSSRSMGTCPKRYPSTETRNDAESGDKSDNKSIMMSKLDMEDINSGDESDHDLISTEMSEDICDRSQTHPNVNRR